MALAIDSISLAELLSSNEPFKKVLVVDCRSFFNYNKSHIRRAINAFYSKMMRRRLFDSKSCRSTVLSQLGEDKCCGSIYMELVLYSEDDLPVGAVNSTNWAFRKLRRKICVNSEELPSKILRNLQEKIISSKLFRRVLILRDGFNDFHIRFPELCESSNEMQKITEVPLSSSNYISQPCVAATYLTVNGPTKILPFLYLGSQQDAMNEKLLKVCGIEYIINLSVNCPQPDHFKDDEHFLRIPVNDSYQDKLLPYFEEAFKFLDKVSQNGSNVLLHCLAGISRSPTLAIAYIMRRNKWTSDQAYRYVKSKRPSISPNFNFMGQLLEYESQLREEFRLALSPSSSCEYSPSPLNQSTDTKNDEIKYIEECSIKIAKSASCDQISKKIARPQNFWRNEQWQMSCKMNENGKRTLGICLLDRPRALDGLRSRKAPCIPKSVNENLPSPSTEFQKLSFTPSPIDDFAVSNPFFAIPQSIPGTSKLPGSPTLLSVENPTFQHLQSAKICSSNVRGNNPTCFFTRITHCIKKRACSSHSSKRSISPSSTSSSPLNSASLCCNISSSNHLSPMVETPTPPSDDFTDSPESGFVEDETATNCMRKVTNIMAGNENLMTSSESYRDADRDSVSSASSLEIVVK